MPLLITAIESQSVVFTCGKCGQTHRETIGTASPEVPRAIAPISLASPAIVTRPGSLESSATASNVVSLRSPSTEAIERAARASRGDPFEVPSGFCPKCVSKRSPSDASCPYCGLDFANYRPETVRPPEWLREPWRELLLTWSNETEHALMRNLATKSNGLPELGRAYRIRLADFPDDPFATRGRDELVRQAATAVNYKPAPDEERTAPWKYVLGFISLALALMASYYILKMAIDAKP